MWIVFSWCSEWHCDVSSAKQCVHEAVVTGTPFSDIQLTWQLVDLRETFE